LTNSSEAFWNANGGTLVLASTGANICSKVWIEAQNKVKCRTLPGVYAAGSLISAKSYLSGETLECIGGNGTASCLYQQLASSNFPEVTSISNTVSKTIVFTGTNFFTSGYTGNASFGGVIADTVTIDSATQATATWKYGLPPTDQDVAPLLWFNSTTTDVIHYANSTNNKLNKALTATASSSGLSCSFAGGCTLEVTSAGLASLLRADSTNNFITVCDEKCSFNETLSSDTVAACKMPPMSTVYSNSNFKIETENEDLKPRTRFGTISNIGVPFDDKLMIQPSNTASTC